MPLWFDSTGFTRQDQNTWVHSTTGDMVALDYFDIVPDLPAALNDLDRLRRELTHLHARTGCLIEAHVINFGGTAALLRLVKAPLPQQPAGQLFQAVITVPKATSSANLMILCPERGTTGIRETMLVADLGMQNWFRPHPYAPDSKGLLPYHTGDDPQFDQRFPDHPLTRARKWLHHAIRTAQIDPKFAGLPEFDPAAPPPPAPATPPQATPPQMAQTAQSQVAQPVEQPAAQPPVPPPPVQIGDQLSTVVLGLPVAGFLPFWLDNDTAGYWQLAEPEKVLARIGVGAIGRSPMADDWRRESMLFDMDLKSLLVADRYKTESGAMAVQPVAGRLATFEEATAAATPAAKFAAFQWVGHIFEQAAARGESIVVGPGGTEMYGRPRVLMMVLPAGPDKLGYIEASPVPVNAPMWQDNLAPDTPLTPESSQSLSNTIRSPEDIRACGPLAGFATDTWSDVHPMHLALSFKQLAQQA